MKTQKFITLLLITLLCCQHAAAQKKKKSYSFNDSLDHAFDMSDFIINANGFIPVPYIITEPALGGFGLAIAPIFIKKRKPLIDTVRGKVITTPVAPDVTGGAVMYTANKSWLVGGGRVGTFVKSRIKYRLLAAYGDINMSFYRTIEGKGEREFKFNFKILPVVAQAIKRIGISKWYAGLSYLFLQTKVGLRGDSLPSFVKDKDLNGIVSQLGIVGEYENRDNIFTPDNGVKLHFDANWADNILGSDYDFWRMNYYMFGYKKIIPSLVAGLKIDGQQVFNDPPFYMLPFINMRGIEAARYQGNATLLGELELRWDFIKRWSILAFGGTGTAFDEWSEFGNTSWQTAYGAGFRYLLARKFKLRLGIDVAKGPDTWAYYIVFGTNWRK